MNRTRRRRTNANDEVVLEEIRTLDGLPFTSGSVASHLAELSIAALPAAEYLRTLDAESTGRSVRRTAGLRVE